MAEQLELPGFGTGGKSKASDYLNYIEIEHNKKIYIFDPYLFGIGMWREKTKKGVGGVTASKSLQDILNIKVFGRKNLPNILDRLRNASPSEARKQEEISKLWLKAKTSVIVSGKSKDISKIPNIIPAKYVTSDFFIGQMFFYSYDALTKEKLPYWDMFPLTIVIDSWTSSSNGLGFLGLNLHYLPKDVRAAFLQSLTPTMSYDSSKNTMKVKLRYENLKGIEKYKAFQPCLKKYLVKQVTTKMLPIEPHEWWQVINLPLQRFQKKSSQFVWNQSLAKIK